MGSLAVLFVAFAGVAAGVFLVLVPLRENVKLATAKNRKEMTRRLDEMFVFIPLEHLPTIKLVAATGFAGLTFFLAFNLPGSAPYIAAAAAAAFGYFSPELLVRWLKMQRRRRFAEQLVDGLIMLSNGLRAGFTMQQALEMLVEESKPPISQEFELVLREFRLGVDLETAMVNCATRVNNDDLSLAVTAIAICRQVGGNLAEIFDRIVTMVRDRKLIEGKVDSLTAQGRLQAIIVALLPWVFAFFCAKINPEMTRLLWTTVPGIIAMAIAVTMDVVGYLWVRKLSVIKY
ncbi:MAG: hypothetical protein E4H02_02785 [Lentisphaerales bacterium]|jgi:tight adherence protein B|nr:MAG: hypothetical protein E4H02_02785 [Lentisphaerales bacterium]